MSVSRVVVDTFLLFDFNVIYVKLKFLVSVGNCCGFSRSYQQLQTVFVEKSGRFTDMFKAISNFHFGWPALYKTKICLLFVILKYHVYPLLLNRK